MLFGSSGVRTKACVQDTMHLARVQHIAAGKTVNGMITQNKNVRFSLHRQCARARGRYGHWVDDSANACMCSTLPHAALPWIAYCQALAFVWDFG